jgi:ABC-2 type transport system permease protein
MVIKSLRLEFRKQLPSATFWIMLSLHAFVLILVATNLNTFLKNANIMVNDIPDLDLALKPILQFPDVWQNVTYIAGYFKIVLALIIITSVSNEFASATARQNIIDGLSRRQWLYTKIGLAKVLALFSTLLVLAVCLTLGFSQGNQVELADVFTGIDFLLAYFIELVVYFIYALFLTLLLNSNR